MTSEHVLSEVEAEARRILPECVPEIDAETGEIDGQHWFGHVVGTAFRNIREKREADAGTN
jgi:hypothetical protein